MRKTPINMYLEQPLIDALKSYASAHETTPSRIVAEFIKNDPRFVVEPTVQSQVKQIDIFALKDAFKGSDD
jgi:hypothetical protein